MFNINHLAAIRWGEDVQILATYPPLPHSAADHALV